MWAIGCVRTGGEISLTERLLQSRVSTYLPMGARHVRRARKRCKAMIQVPAFPGYIFIEDHTVTDRIYEEPGFYDFMRDQGQRYLLPDTTDDDRWSIAKIRAMEERGMFSDEKPGRPRFTIGEVLMIPGFSNHYGRVVDLQGDRVKLDGAELKWPIWVNGLQLVEGSVDLAA